MRWLTVQHTRMAAALCRLTGQQVIQVIEAAQCIDVVGGPRSPVRLDSDSARAAGKRAEAGRHKPARAQASLHHAGAHVGGAVAGGARALHGLAAQLRRRVGRHCGAAAGAAPLVPCRPAREQG